jgi:gliding motility-associated-like protein
MVTVAQICPANIDFESGTFAGWTCYIGSAVASGTTNELMLGTSGPIPGRHTMFSNPGAGYDPYGGFPINCPNGSGYSIRLGNDLGGGEAEGISYQFTIPAGQDVYSLIYHYAVVFQDPNHEEYQQPRLELEITNVTDNVVIDCSSFTFIPYGNILPGFFESPDPGSSTPVWCKDWSAVSINLDHMAGKTIKLFFKTGDCTFRRHFGYAYIDVNSECTSEFVGATYCPDDTTVNVTAPHGYQGYTWFNSNFTQVLGSQQTISFTPPPAVGTTIAVEVVPYNGYGCLDTLYAQLIDTLTVVSNAGKDTLSCNGNPVPIGAIPKPGLVYSWSPATGLSSPGLANPLANPLSTTVYVLTTRHDGGGCVDTDTVTVKASYINDSLQLIGKAAYCFGYGDSSILKVQPTDNIQWYKDGVPIGGATATTYRVNQTGSYYAMLMNSFGCRIATRKQDIVIDRPKPATRYAVEYAVIDIPITLEARRIGSTVLWKPSNYLNDPASYTPIFQSSEDQLYTIEIKTATGCLTVDTQLVKIVKYVEIYVPSAFTPNRDGKNDFLHPVLMGVKDLHYFKIYNRWGQLVYSTTSELPGWDGTIHGVAQSTQSYVWIAEGLGVDGKIYRRKGTSTLVR